MNMTHQPILSVALVLGLGMGCATQSGAALYEVRYTNGQTRFQVEEVDGNPHGRAVTYHLNGKKSSEGFYKNGHPHGHFRYWDERGAFVEQRVYDSGTITWSSRDPGATPPSGHASFEVRDSPRYPAQPKLVAEVSAGATGDVPFTLDGSAPDPGMLLSGTMLIRGHDLVLAGATLSYATTSEDQSQLYAGATLGHRFQLGWRVRPEAFLEVGAHQVRQLSGFSLANDNENENVLVPYMGLRLGAAIDIMSNVALSLSVTGRRDTHKRTRIVAECRDDSCPQMTWQVGGSFLTGQLALQLVFD